MSTYDRSGNWKIRDDGARLRPLPGKSRQRDQKKPRERTYKKIAEARKRKVMRRLAR